MNTSKLILLGLLIVSFSNSYCQESNNKEVKLEFEVFKEIPAEINACACYFSKSEMDYNSNEYIFVNDFAKNAFIKLNGKIEKFERIENSDKQTENTYRIYKSGEFILQIELTKKTPMGEEISKLIGVMILTNNKGLRISMNFFGTCGC